MQMVTLEQATVLFILMLVAQIPLLIAAVVQWIKSRSNAEAIKEVHEKTVAAASAASAAAEKVDIHAQQIEQKLDHNTEITKDAADAAQAVTAHTTQCSEQILALIKTTEDHHLRISSLEGQMASLRAMTENVDKNLTSTRHEIRTYLATIITKLDIDSMKKDQTEKK